MRDSVWGKSSLDIKEISEIELLTLIVVWNSCVVYINLVNRGPISQDGVFIVGCPSELEVDDDDAWRMMTS